MSKIIGNTTATPVPRSDWNQTDSKKADFILNKPDVATKDYVNDVIDALGDTYYTEAEIDSKVATLNSAISGKAASSHSHVASDITSGTLSSDRLPTVPITKGGTGATTAKGAENAILGDMAEASSGVNDNTLMVYRVSAPSASNGVTRYRTAADLWTYIAGKIRSVFGFSSSNVLPIANGGTGATTAAKALTNLGVTATSEELNKLDGVTATMTELNYVNGVTSNIQVQLDGKAASDHNHDDKYDTKDAANSALSSAKTYTDQKIAAIPIPDALADLTADSTHRTVTDTEKATWNAKSNFSGSYNDLTNKPTIPSIAGLASTSYVDGEVAKKVDKVSGKGLSTNDYTTDEKTKLAGIATGAEVNQNAFSNVVVGSTTIAADSKTDSLTIAAGTGISVSGDATNDKVTITNSGVRSIGTGSKNGTISVNTNGTAADVAVKGLGSAAYTASTAYDAAGAAQTKADAALASAKSYTDGKISALLDGADDTTLDSIKELADAIKDNDSAIDALNNIAAGKANATHTHAITDVENLKNSLDAINSELDGSIKGLSVSGKTITYTKNDGTTGTITTQDTNTDTKVNVTLGKTTKAYLLGTSSTPTSTAAAVTAISDTGVYLDTTAGQLVATTFKGALDGNAKTATSATSAGSATKATQDGSGNTITSTYETKADAKVKFDAIDNTFADLDFGSLDD